MDEIKQLLKLLLDLIYPTQPKFENPVPIKDRPIEERTTRDRDIVILKDMLTVNKYSRPGIAREAVLGIEVHWTGNPNTSAKANRNFFEKRKGGKEGFGSTQFICDIDGDIIQMISESEIAYSSGAKSDLYTALKRSLFKKAPYYYTLSVECCVIDGKGTMTSETQDALKRLLVYLCRKYGLNHEQIYLHYELTGKICHKWYVSNPKEWAALKTYVRKELDEA